MAHLARKLLHTGLMPWLVGLFAAALIVGCGGGTDTASNGVGVGGTGAAAGPVTGYGSLIVNDIHFEFGNARFTTEDAADSGQGVSNDQGDESTPSASEDRPVGFGTMVNITSGDVVREANGDDRAQASIITLVSAIKGPISAITIDQANPDVGTLTVLGQTVKVDASTQYADNHDLSQLAVQDKVVVYGNLDSSTGIYQATRVEYRAHLLSYKVRGYITGKTTTSLTLRGLTVTLPLSARNQTWSVGQLVRVRMLASVPNVAMVVQAVGARLNDGVKARQTGMITCTSSTTCLLDGVPLNFSQATGVPSQLTSGKRLEVEGEMRDGVLVCTKVTAEDEETNFTRNVKVRGQISRLTQSDGSGQFQLRGGLVTFSPATDIRGSALVNGQWVEVEGPTTGDGTATVQATRISPLQTNQH
ncbi:MAG: hypothetical protein RI907_2427 [Pseudomonadota bacterium]